MGKELCNAVTTRGTDEHTDAATCVSIRSTCDNDTHTHMHTHTHTHTPPLSSSSHLALNKGVGQDCLFRRPRNCRKGGLARPTPDKPWGEWQLGAMAIK